MIGLTKLLSGTATVSQVLTHAGREAAPPGMLQFMQDRGPIVVWNVTRRCNLACEHCYAAVDEDPDTPELDLEEGRLLIEDLARARVPVLLFSGGEPLLRDEVYTWCRAADEAGMRPSLSTNGTLITDRVARRLKRAGFAYVGVSLDGTASVHDGFRGESGSFERSLAGLRAAKRAGLRTGVRFTVCADNLDELPRVLDLVEAEGIPRFCLYHLVYAGRGASLRRRDISAAQRREVIERLIARTLDWSRRGVGSEILTVDNHADGVYAAQWVREHMPGRLEEVKKLLELHGGCSAGTKFASIGPSGEVHPCQFWPHASFGNVMERPFGVIWADLFNPLMRTLKVKAPHLAGKRCRKCEHRTLCAGCRVRAEADTGDPWGDDPCCYLTDAEIRSGL